MKPVLLCFSHLRWNFVFQRPQQLLTRASRSYRVVFLEEPLFEEERQVALASPRLDRHKVEADVLVAVPVLPVGLDVDGVDRAQRALLDGLLQDLGCGADIAVAWFYTAMAVAFSDHLRPRVIVWDCMDELSGFAGASPRLALFERRLLKATSVVFTGGRSLFEAKQRHHPDTHLFPSAVDAQHFALARDPMVRAHDDAAGQAGLPRPRLGWFGVVDERMDLALLDAVAVRRPGWSLVMIGPVVKIDPAALPRRPNIHWLGMKSYAELPRYLAGWDVGLMPFALNEATRFISPTKTPEYLAAGVPVLSTAVADVIRDWGNDRLVEVVHDADGLVAATEALLARPSDAWLRRVDARLARISWDATWEAMNERIVALFEVPPCGTRTGPVPVARLGASHV